MKTTTFDVPALYGDHHVLEVRRVLSEMPGIENIYASSAFRAIEVTFDPDKVSEQDIRGKLDEMGYLDDLPMPVEADASTYLQSDRSESYFRHTAVFETNKETISFTQKVSYTGRPLWYCPGFGAIKDGMEE